MKNFLGLRICLWGIWRFSKGSQYCASNSLHRRCSKPFFFDLKPLLQSAWMYSNEQRSETRRNRLSTKLNQIRIEKIQNLERKCIRSQDLKRKNRNRNYFWRICVWSEYISNIYRYRVSYEYCLQSFIRRRSLDKIINVIFKWRP